MKVLVCGDIVGRSGREIIEDKIPELRKKENLEYYLNQMVDGIVKFCYNK